MDDKIDSEAILIEILDVLKKHSIPAKTITIDVSLLSPDFESLFPHLKNYKAGHFSRPLIIEDIPVKFLAKRRIPFSELIEWLELNALPLVKEVAAEVERGFVDVKSHFRVNHYEDHPRLARKNNYSIEVECRLRNEPEIQEANTVMLSIGVRQIDATSYPILYGFVGWLVDEESGGDWGIDTVYNLNQLNLEVSESGLIYKKREFPMLRQHLLNEVAKLTSGK